MRRILENERALVGVLILLSSLLYILNLGTVSLSGKHESLYAEVAREMLADGNWVVPHFNGEPYPEKPPLYFWLVSIFSIPNGDVNEFTARLPAALCAIGTVIVTFFLGRRLFNERVAFLGALMLASCLLFQVYGRTARLDTTFTFFISAALLAFYSGYTSGKRANYLLLWLFIAAAVLTKGLLGLFLVLGPIVLYLFWDNDLKALKGLRPISGGLIFLLVISTWLLPAFMQKEDGGYLKQFMFINSGLRYAIPLLESKHHHSLLCSIGYFFYGIGPWSIFLPLVLYQFFSEKSWRLNKHLLFPSAWLLFMACIFALMGTKRHTYFLPLYPPSVLLIATWWNDLIERSSNIPSSWVLKGLGCFLVIMLGVEVDWVCQAMSPRLVALSAFTIFFILSFGYFLCYSRRYKELFIFVLLIATSSGVSYNQVFLPRDKEEVAQRAFFKELNSCLGTSSAIAIYGKGADSSKVLFYLDRHPRNINSIDALEEFFHSEGKVYCLMTERDYSLLSRKVSMHIVKEFHREHVFLISKS